MIPPILCCVGLVIGAPASACASVSAATATPGTPAVTSADGEVVFERHEVVTGLVERQTVLTGFLLGGAIADLVVVSVDERDHRRLRIYAFDDGAWALRVEATLRPEALFVDVADIAGRDHLIVGGPGRLERFDPGSGTGRALVAVATGFGPPRGGGIPHVDVTRDLNGDGRDDLVVPGEGGFQVFVQEGDGRFADPVRIGPPGGIDLAYGAGGYRHDPWLLGGVHPIDFDLDGRVDLAYWHAGRLEVHLQDERGLFEPETRTFTIDVALDGGRNPCSRRPEHGFDPVEFCYESDHAGLATGDRTEKVLHALADLNGDGVADLMAFSLEGKSVFSVRSAYEVHFGAPAPGDGTAFAAEAGASIGAEGLPGWLEAHDLDGDGRVDLALATLRVGFFRAIGSILSRSASLDLAFYRMEDGRYPDRANATRKVRIDLGAGASGEKRAAYAPVLIGDVNGDGRDDLLAAKGRKALHLFAGVPGPDLFAPRPARTAVAVPADTRYAWLADLDGDGRQDIVVHHASKKEPQRVTMLVAR